MSWFRHFGKAASGPVTFFSGVITLALVLLGVRGATFLLSWKCAADYSLISPFARCSATPSPIRYVRAYEEFEADLSNWIDSQVADGSIIDGAVYFRDLQNGPWFGIHEKDQFLPASLFKLPVMMRVLKLSETNPAFLNEQLATSTLPNIPNNTTDPTRTLTPGTYYTVDELLHKMIAYSDNYSMDLLFKRLASMNPNEDPARKLYSDLGLLTAEDAETISVKEYASLFRVLYDARYLNEDSSQKALSLLALSEFKQGLVAGVPSDVVIAHKFGIHNTKDIKLLHDCGIVYHPERPYLLCVMTHSKSIGNSIKFISEVSRRVYQEVLLNTRASL
jgi:beta-lactamase class A